MKYDWSTCPILCCVWLTCIRWFFQSFNMGQVTQWSDLTSCPRVHHSSGLICSHLDVLSALSGSICLQFIWWAHFVLSIFSRPQLNVQSNHDEGWCSNQPPRFQRSLTLSAVQSVGCWDIMFECDNQECRVKPWDVRCLLAPSWGFFPFRNNLLTWISTLCLNQISSWDVSKLGFLGRESERSLWHDSTKTKVKALQWLYSSM